MKAAAFFDMEGTLLRGESQFSFLLWCVRKRKAPLLPSAAIVFEYAAYLAGASSDAQRLRQAGFSLFKGRRAEELAERGRRFCQGFLEKRIRRFASRLVESHRRNGHAVVLVTSAVEALAKRLAEHFRCDCLVATRLAVQDGILTGAREFPEPYGTGKRQLLEQLCIERELSPEESYAYSDHASDNAIFEWARYPVAVNPTRRRSRTAFQRNWHILDLDRGVPPELIDW